MSVCFVFFLCILIYVVSVGLLTVMESKVLSVLQLSSSLCSITVFSFYHFFLDFLKVLGKGLIFTSFCLGNGVLVNLLFYFLLVFVCFLVLPVNCFYIYYYYWYLFFIFFDSICVFFKVFILNYYSFKFVGFSSYKMKSVYMFGEILFFLFCFKIFGLYIFLGWCYFDESLVSVTYFNLFFFFNVVVFILISFMLKIFSLPFDYIELESEFGGGLVLEVFGVGFVVWSLIEYLMILNSVMFFSLVLSVLMGISLHNVCSFFNLSLIVFVFLIYFFVSFVFLVSGVFLSVSFISSFFFLMKLYVFFLFYLLVFFIYFLVM